MRDVLTLSCDLVDSNEGHARGGWVWVVGLPKLTGACLAHLSACSCWVGCVKQGNLCCLHGMQYHCQLRWQCVWCVCDQVWQVQGCLGVTWVQWGCMGL